MHHTPLLPVVQRAGFGCLMTRLIYALISLQKRSSSLGKDCVIERLHATAAIVRLNSE